MPSYVVPSARMVKHTRRVMRMARALGYDSTEPDAIAMAKDEICGQLRIELKAREEGPEFDEKSMGKARVSYGAQVCDVNRQMYIDSTVGEVATSPQNIDHLFEEAGRRISGGFHREFWQRLIGDEQDYDNI